MLLDSAAGPSPCSLLHMEVRFGKTLAGTDRALCTLIRHRDVLQCALGATALHYIVRFGALLPDSMELRLDTALLSELMFPFRGKCMHVNTPPGQHGLKCMMAAFNTSLGCAICCWFMGMPS